MTTADKPITKLQRLRVARGKSRNQVSQETGIPYTSLERLESGAGDRVILQHLRTLAVYYGEELDIWKLLS